MTQSAQRSMVRTKMEVGRSADRLPARGGLQATSPLLSKLVPILYEDESLLVVVKPAGVDTGDARDGSKGGLVDWLTDLRHLSAKSEQPANGPVAEFPLAQKPYMERLHASNRLSRYESGILVLGKNRGAAERLRAALRAGRVELEYFAVVNGRMSVPRLVIGVDDVKTSETRKPARNQKRTPIRSRRTAPKLETQGKTTLVRVQQGEKRTLVRCLTRVENTHALRAQFRSVKLRLVGDLLHDHSFRPKSPRDTWLHLTRLTLPETSSGSAPSVSSPMPPGFAAAVDGQYDVERALRAGLVRRLRCLAEPNTDCFRLLTGNVEDVPGLVAEKYGPVIILQVLDESAAWIDSLPWIAKWYLKSLGAHAAYVKRFVKDRSQSDEDLTDELRSAKPLVGKPVSEEVEVLERGLRFLIRPYDGFSVGLFLDQRENRDRVKSCAEGKQVLNLFAYTCGFSLAAAVGGAARTVSVDVSAKHLEWGRKNFALNGIEGDHHEFFRADSVDFLLRAARDRRRFDLVIVDPPTFAHGRRGKRQFSITEDLAGLLGKAVEVLNPGGMLLLSTNYRRLSMKALRDRLREGARGRAYKTLETPRLPDDFAVDPDHAKTIFVQFE